MSLVAGHYQTNLGGCLFWGLRLKSLIAVVKEDG